MKDIGVASFVLCTMIIQMDYLVCLKIHILRSLNYWKCRMLNPLILMSKRTLFKLFYKWKEIKEIGRSSYVSAVGCLMYDMICTCLGICFTIELVSHLQSILRHEYWKTVKRVLPFLHGTTNYMICYQGEDRRLSAYTDAD